MQALLPGGEQVLKAGHLAFQDFPPGLGQDVGFARQTWVGSRLVFILHPGNQTLLAQALQGTVQRAGAEDDAAVAERFYIFQDGIAVFTTGDQAE